MEPQVIPDYETEFEGVHIKVKDARVSKCTHCGETSYGARELSRWKQLKVAKLAELNQIPSADDVKRVRKSLELSVSDFAALVGVTRQTVHSWERAESGGMPFGPAAILVCLLDAKACQEADQVYSRLLSLAKRRGQLAKVAGPPQPVERSAVPLFLLALPGGAPTFCTGPPRSNGPPGET
jgi:DNA-binding transcriptional regulator YiaG